MYAYLHCTFTVCFINYFYTIMAGKTVECPHVDEDVDNLMGKQSTHVSAEQSTHISGEQSTNKTLSQLEANMAKMAENMAEMVDMMGCLATKRECVDSTHLLPYIYQYIQLGIIPGINNKSIMKLYSCYVQGF